MGGLSAGAADSTVLVPSADTTVVSRLLSQGLSASPGRHSQTVPDDSADGEAVAAGEAIARRRGCRRGGRSATRR